MTKIKFLVLILIASVFTALPAPLPGADIDWSGFKSTSVTLFYPGRTSWEFLMSDDHRLGARSMARGKRDCAHCHLSPSGEMDLLADEIAAGTAKMKRSQMPFEDEPMPGKRGLLFAKVQAAYDDTFLYVRIEWPSKGRSWYRKEDPPDMVSLQVNKKSSVFKKYGCFITCHNDLDTMPHSPPIEELNKSPYYSKMDRKEVRLYAYFTRDGGWDRLKDVSELDRLLHEHGLIDVWSVELKGGRAEARDGWIFEDRRWDEKADVEASARWNNKKYAVVIKRRLSTGDGRDVEIKEGEVINAGIAIHDEGAAKRKHYVSLPIEIGIGTKAWITAERIR